MAEPMSFPADFSPSDRLMSKIERAHHAMVDGVSGVDVSLVLLDMSPDTQSCRWAAT